MRQTLQKLFSPPYKVQDLYSIFIALFIMLAIPMTVLQILSVRDNRSSAEVINQDDTTLPTVEFQQPSDGAIVTGSNYKIIANADDDMALDNLSLSIDGKVVKSFPTGPFEYNWNITKVAPGNHTLVATATDVAGNKKSSTVKVYRSAHKPTD